MTMKTQSLLFVLASAVAFSSATCTTSNAQEEFQDICMTFWQSWGTHDFESAVGVSSVPFTYCNGQTVVKTEDVETLSKLLESLRRESEIGTTISVNIKRASSFKEIPIDSFRMNEADRLKLKEFFNEDDQALYVELKHIDDDNRDKFILLVRWFDGKPKAIGILD